ncbi:YndM family protein [Halobacillus sp. A1]|uniref:DUF2512 family protein n=1 Tax=Halobacillus sp. A1 TaxID=2880262 RepID=UPI0020A6AEE8|nr:DUF2512 family protein [Halobacillus sp. A1]MCP3033320.1 YndM family protein [Halobacillus sp. A1]
MEHGKLIASKLIFASAWLFLILGIGYDLSFANVLFISVVLTAVSYIVGDRIILPRVNSTVSSLFDFAIAFLVIYFMLNALTVDGGLWSASLYSAIGIGIYEFVFNQYVRSSGNEEKTESERIEDLDLRTEASDELTPYHSDEDK